MLYLLLYLLIINLIGLEFMRSDKARAKRRRHRISERRLLVTAILGGSVGVLAGMKMYRHKTKHAAFYIGIPVILFIQLVILGYVWGRLFI